MGVHHCSELLSSGIAWPFCRHGSKEWPPLLWTQTPSSTGIHRPPLLPPTSFCTDLQKTICYKKITFFFAWACRACARLPQSPQSSSQAGQSCRSCYGVPVAFTTTQPAEPGPIGDLEHQISLSPLKSDKVPLFFVSKLHKIAFDTSCDHN